MEQPALQRKIGRPLSFDRQQGLHKAMLLFWQHGYEGTSLSDLTRVMGIKPPSLYAAFGDKEHLFLEAVELYLNGDITSRSIIETAPTAGDAAFGLLKAAAVGFTGDATPKGCLLASSTSACSPASVEVQMKLSQLRGSIENCLAERITSAVATGEIAPESDSQALASHVMAVIQGMSTLARDGASRAKLLKITEIAMAAWPK